MRIGHRFTARTAARRIGLAAVALALAAVAGGQTAAAATPSAQAGSSGPAAPSVSAASVRPQVSAGDTIYSGSGTACRTVVNARNASAYFIIMPGHCTLGTSAWYTTPALTTYIGPTVATSFPGNDYGLIRYDNPAVPHPGGGYTPGSPYVGEHVCRTSQVSGVHCGTVTALNATVNYGGGQVVTGLIATTVCTDPGDTGGLLVAGSTALGLFSGGSGNCTSGGTSYYQPLAEALAAFGLTLY